MREGAFVLRFGAGQWAIGWARFVAFAWRGTNVAESVATDRGKSCAQSLDGTVAPAVAVAFVAFARAVSTDGRDARTRAVCG